MCGTEKKKVTKSDKIDIKSYAIDVFEVQHTKVNKPLTKSKNTIHVQQ